MGRVGIIGAMPVEIEMLKAHVTNQTEHKVGKVFVVTTGELEGNDVVFAASNVGMVFAAMVATTLIERFDAEVIVFTGVAGALKRDLDIGDIIVARSIANYDIDCTNFAPPFNPNLKYARGQIPFLDWRHYAPPPFLLALALDAPRPSDHAFKAGALVSGSEFLTEARKKDLAGVWEEMGAPDAVEMEGAGAAQACEALSVPFLALRAISDKLEGDANEDFNEFCKHAAENLWPVVCHVVRNFHKHKPSP